jgi:hypothetical protein
LMHSRPSIRERARAASREHVLPAYALVALALAYFAVMATGQIALGGPVARRIFGIPVMNISYIGALKSYIYFPILGLFGASPETVLRRKKSSCCRIRSKIR